MKKPDPVAYVLIALVALVVAFCLGAALVVLKPEWFGNSERPDKLEQGYEWRESQRLPGRLPSR